jgi:hypothetical protein
MVPAQARPLGILGHPLRRSGLLSTLVPGIWGYASNGSWRDATLSHGTRTHRDWPGTHDRQLGGVTAVFTEVLRMPTTSQISSTSRGPTAPVPPAAEAYGSDDEGY